MTPDLSAIHHAEAAGLHATAAAMSEVAKDFDFSHHSQVVRPGGIMRPRQVTLEVRPLGPAFSKDPAIRDAYLDRLIEEEERQRRADIAAENVTESRAFPQRPNRHDD